MGRKKKKQSRPWCWYPFFVPTQEDGGGDNDGDDDDDDDPRSLLRNRVFGSRRSAARSRGEKRSAGDFRGG